jgi:hypothetical protein
MRRERLRDVAFVAVIAIVLAFVSLAIWQKSADCSNRGREFRIYGRAWMQCHLPDGTIETM